MRRLLLFAVAAYILLCAFSAYQLRGWDEA